MKKEPGFDRSRPKATSLDFVRQAVLSYIRKRGSATQDQAISDLDWPSVLVSTVIGFLLQDGLLQAKRVNGELVLLVGSSQQQS